MSNPYSLLLKQYISKSEKSLSEIEIEMRKRGFKRNKAYLSSLQNGKMPVPSIEETQALCEIVGGDPTRLALTGVLPFVGNLIEDSEEAYFRSLMDTIITILATLADINKKKIEKELITYIEKNPDKFGKIPNNDNDSDIDFFKFENLKMLMTTLVNSEFNWDELIIQAIKGDSEIETPMDILESFTEDTNDLQNSQEEKLSPDELNYLTECLRVYRKLNLKPD